MNQSTEKSTRANRSFLILLLIFASISSLASEVRQFKETTAGLYGTASSWLREASNIYARNQALVKPACTGGNPVEHAVFDKPPLNAFDEANTSASADIASDIKIVVIKKVHRTGVASSVKRATAQRDADDATASMAEPETLKYVFERELSPEVMTRIAEATNAEGVPDALNLAGRMGRKHVNAMTTGVPRDFIFRTLNTNIRVKRSS